MTDHLYGARAEDLLKGGIDLHHHGYPEISLDVRTRTDDVTELTLARDAGMAAIVLKSHMFPTMGRAYHLSRLVEGIDVVSSITLNPMVGGFSPLAVETAGRLGAKALFMPTWGAAHDRSRKGFSRHLAEFIKSAENLTQQPGLTVTDESGRVRSEVRECLTVAAEFGMMVATAHISPRESIALAGAAKDCGIGSIFFQHPDSNSVAATRDDIRELAALDAVCEICALGLLPPFQRISVGAVREIVEEIGPAKCALTTDYFFDWAPPAAETLRMIIGVFLSQGISADDIRIMIRDTPARLLGRRTT